MRLLNTSTLKFRETYDPTALGYMILSHRWSDEEVSFDDFLIAQQPEELIPPWQMPSVRRTQQSLGYEKIRRLCSFAKDRNFEWCWMDTCCIDKRSSAELSEAINSMWNWYRSASVCCVYLLDVPALDHDEEIIREKLRSSRWFYRCWTLQELLAPRKLLFCNKEWEVFRSITKDTFFNWISNTVSPDSDATHDSIAELSSITGFPEAVLSDRSEIRNRAIAQRMSWAA